MVRAILGVIVGYIVMAILVMVLFVGMWFALGVDGMLESGTFQGKWTINIGAPLISIIGALVGGAICMKVGRSRKAVLVFACLVLAAGLVAAAVGWNKPEPGPRKPGLSVFEALQQGREPNWYLLVNPIIGAAGILIGGRLARQDRAAQAPGA